MRTYMCKNNHLTLHSHLQACWASKRCWKMNIENVIPPTLMIVLASGQRFVSKSVSDVCRRCLCLGLVLIQWQWTGNMFIKFSKAGVIMTSKSALMVNVNRSPPRVIKLPWWRGLCVPDPVIIGVKLSRALCHRHGPPRQTGPRGGTRQSNAHRPLMITFGPCFLLPGCWSPGPPSWADLGGGALWRAPLPMGTGWA